MRETLRKKLTAGGIAGALVLGIGAIAGAATGGGSDRPTPASRVQVDETVGTVPTSDVTAPTSGVTTPTLDDHGNDGIEHEADDDHGRDDDGDVDEDSDDNSGPGSGPDGDRSGSNSGPG